jgi:hypothetical protein
VKHSRFKPTAPTPLFSAKINVLKAANGIAASQRPSRDSPPSLTSRSIRKNLQKFRTKPPFFGPVFRPNCDLPNRATASPIQPTLFNPQPKAQVTVEPIPARQGPLKKR